MLQTESPLGKSLSAEFSIQDKICFLHNQLDKGYWIFPLHTLRVNAKGEVVCGCEGVGRCQGAGKHPFIRWSGPWDPAKRRTWKNVERNCDTEFSRGFGIHVGLSKLVVLDVDPRNGGLDTLRKLCEQFGVDVPKYHVNASGGGGHVYFRAPIWCDVRKGFCCSTGKTRCAIVLGPGLEMFAGQHYTVMAYSPHKSGIWYTPGEATEITELPEWLVGLVTSHPAFKVAKATPAKKKFSSDNTAFVAGVPNFENARKYIERIPAPACGQGQCEQHAYRVAALLCIDFGLRPHEAFPLLDSAVNPSHGWTGEQLLRKLEDAWQKSGPKAFRGQGKITDDEPGGISEAQLQEIADDTSAATQWHLDKEAEKKASEVPTQIVGTSDEEERIRQRESFHKQLQRDKLHGGTFGEYPCTCSFMQIHRHCAESIGRILRLSGKKWTCERCGRERRAHHKATHIIHLESWREKRSDSTDDVLYKFMCPDKNLKAVLRRNQRKKGQYFRLDQYPMTAEKAAETVIVSTVAPRWLPYEEINSHQAEEFLNGIVDEWPWAIKRKCWWSSRDWKLIGCNEKKETEWMKVGKARGTFANHVGIFKAYLCRTENFKSNGKYFRAWICQFYFNPADWKNIFGDLQVGEYTGNPETMYIYKTDGLDLASATETAYVASP